MGFYSLMINPPSMHIAVCLHKYAWYRQVVENTIRKDGLPAPATVGFLVLLLLRLGHINFKRFSEV